MLLLLRLQSSVEHPVYSVIVIIQGATNQFLVRAPDESGHVYVHTTFHLEDLQPRISKILVATYHAFLQNLTMGIELTTIILTTFMESYRRHPCFLFFAYTNGGL